MIKKIVFATTVLLIGITTLNSCSKDEGKGGKASIAGYVYKINNEGDIAQAADGSYYFVTDTTAAADEDVFIVYGGGHDEAYDDKTSTNANGYFKFDYLCEGDYTVYALSDSTIQKSGIYRDLNIGKSGTHSVSAFYIEDGNNSGRCGAVGKIQALYSKNSTYIAGVALRVYLKNNNTSESDDLRADDTGTFYFKELQPYSSYTIWAESEPTKNAGLVAVEISFSTGAKGSINDLTSTPLQVTIQ